MLMLRVSIMVCGDWKGGMKRTRTKTNTKRHQSETERQPSEAKDETANAFEKNKKPKPKPTETLRQEGAVLELLRHEPEKQLEALGYVLSSRDDRQHPRVIEVMRNLVTVPAFFSLVNG